VVRNDIRQNVHYSGNNVGPHEHMTLHVLHASRTSCHVMSSRLIPRRRPHCDTPTMHTAPHGRTADGMRTSSIWDFLACSCGSAHFGATPTLSIRLSRQRFQTTTMCSPCMKNPQCTLVHVHSRPVQKCTGLHMQARMDTYICITMVDRQHLTGFLHP
jgi:hypothetical protein